MRSIWFQKWKSTIETWKTEFERTSFPKHSRFPQKLYFQELEISPTEFQRSSDGDFQWRNHHSFFKRFIFQPNMLTKCGHSFKLYSRIKLNGDQNNMKNTPKRKKTIIFHTFMFEFILKLFQGCKLQVYLPHVTLSSSDQEVVKNYEGCVEISKFKHFTVSP